MEIPVNQILQGDCLEIMRGFPDKSIDLVLTDPPYGMDYQSSRRIDRYEKIVGDSDISWFVPFAKEVFRVMKDNRHIYIFCNDYAISEDVDMPVIFHHPKYNHTSGDL